MMQTKPVAIIGAGPAGLAAAHELVGRGIKPIVLEKAGMVGGLSRTETYNGYLFDIGGHRFFTKNKQVNQLWAQMLGTDFIKVNRQSRIYYRGRFFDYPLNIRSTLRNLSVTESLMILLSYLKAQVSPIPQEETLEQWVSNRFGERLYRTFFQTYTEKVWGISCKQIRADWAAQRIKGLSLAAAVTKALTGNHSAKSLTSEFKYPLQGPGMMWRRFQQAIEAQGGQVYLNSEVNGLALENGAIRRVSFNAGGETKEIPVGHVISSMPISNLVMLIKPEPPAEVLDAARQLSYRAIIVVALIVDKEDLFPDQWIYIHSPRVNVGRIQNFKNWSAAMAPDPHKTGVGMEYFCNEGDTTWNTPDAGLIDMASRELASLGLADADDISEGFVIRQPKAYPVYDSDYGRHLGVIRNFIEALDNLQTIGRNGMHRYNNMDHSMLTGMMAAQNIFNPSHNLWAVNEEEDYLEEDNQRRAEPIVDEKILMLVFAQMDKLAFATAIGTVAGLLVFLATIWLIIKGGPVIGPNLQLLSQYFMGYTVTVQGALIGFGYSFCWGFLFGWLYAYLRNLFLSVYVYRVKRRAELVSFMDLIDQL